MPTLIQAALLGIVQGLTEFLPVSSTAHLLITERLLGFRDPGGVFTVVIQLGSILAVVWLYRAKIAKVLTGLPGDPQARQFTLAVFVAVLPALIVGALLADFVKRVLYQTLFPTAVAFVLGGIVMLAIDRLRPAPSIDQVDRVPAGRGLIVGLWQVLALIPGVSRSGASMVGGMMAGLDRATAAEFSFFLAIPTVFAAFAHDLLELGDGLGSVRGSEIAVGFVAAFLASAAVVKPFVNYLRRSGFAPFAWYRIAIGVVLMCAIAVGKF